MATLQLEHPSTRVRGDQDNNDSTDSYWRFDCRWTFIPASADPTGESVHQTGTGYSSNNAGDGPEKTRDRKSWFPRFKSNWLGTFRSKQMFPCCECAVVSSPSNSSVLTQSGRYKGAEGKHCRCGKDQWHYAKSVEEAEYNRRMAISKALGGMRYDEAVLRLRSMGQSELDFKPSEFTADHGSPPQQRSIRDFTPSSLSSSSLSSNPPKRARSVSSGPLPTSTSRSYAAPQLMKPELPTLSAMPYQAYGYENSTKQYGAYNSGYGNNSIEYALAVQPQPNTYEQLTPAPFGDEEGFGELLQGILEDDSRVATGTNMSFNPNHSNSYAAGRNCYYAGASSNSVAPLKRTMSMPSYAMTSSCSPREVGVEQAYYADANRRSSLNLGVPSLYTNYRPAPHQQPVLQQFSYQQQQQQHPHTQQQYSRPLSMTPSMATVTSTSFST
ncbi:unnamed protein product [Peronospora effusa]|uniref:Uncharacterized protein n=1 Tax=Peronospora effusa TaxID=542832 RepID=A0A3M6VQD2_9STRA|nr:hypothetical protein DD238_004146 [Peronospora effusa]CAI5701372.1 unnamed protein product [Peronospora effusa]